MSGEDLPSNDYNLDFQVGGLFIVMGCSAAGVFLSMWLSNMNGQHDFIVALVFALKCFGTGIIIGTATVHLINESAEYFEEASGLLNSSVFEAWPMIFVQIGILVMSLVDFFIGRSVAVIQASESMPSSVDTESNRTNGLINMNHGHSHGISNDPSNEVDIDVKSIESTQSEYMAFATEAAVLTHSILIGFNLGLQSGSEYTTLLIAVSFHQFFEGFALGQILMNSGLTKMFKKAIMAACYAITTSIGVAIGIGVHSTFGDEYSPGVNSLMGVLNSFCGGVLLYLGLVNMCTAWITNNATLRTASVWYALLAYASFALGMAVMSIIGIWA